jgi:lipopolysaccharide transport system permease protein
MRKAATERRYTHEGTGTTFFGILRSIFSELGSSHNLGYRLAVRNIKARYRQSFLGMFWIFLPPIATSAVWILLHNQKLVSFTGQAENYPLFVVIGTTLWQIFSSSVVGPIQAVNAAKGILTKINFPREAVLFTAFYEIMLNALIGIAIITVASLTLGNGLDSTYFHLLGGVVMLIGIGMAVSLFLLPFALLFQDVLFALPTALQFAMYLTPVVYPKPVLSGIDWLFRANPVGVIIQHVREALMHGTFSFDSSLLWITGGTLLALVFGVVLFRIIMEVVIERMGG